MSCSCGCCPKCGCRATCTCNNSLQAFESRGDFSYLENVPVKTVAEKFEEDSFNGDLPGASQADHRRCSDGADGAVAKKGGRAFNTFKADYGYTE